jgi:hypothetical protein
MSRITSTTPMTTTDCPSWCVNHVRPEDVHGGVQWGGDTTLHIGADVEGETTEGRWVVGHSVDGPTPATLDADADGQMTTDQGRAFAAAIVATCDLLEGAPATSTANIARRVAERIRSTAVDASQMAALAATLGMTLEEVLGLDPA